MLVFIFPALDYYQPFLQELAFGRQEASYTLEKGGGEELELKNEQELKTLIVWDLGTSHVGKQIHVQRG